MATPQTDTATATNWLANYQQPGLNAFNEVLSQTDLPASDVQSLLKDLDEKNYIFIASAIAANSLPPGQLENLDQKAQNLILLLQSAVFVSQKTGVISQSSATIAQKSLEDLSEKPHPALNLYQAVAQEYPEEMTRHPDYFEGTDGKPNPLIDQLKNASGQIGDTISEQIKKRVGQEITDTLRGIWHNWTSSPTGQAVEEHFISTTAPEAGAATGVVVGATTAPVIVKSIPTSALTALKPQFLAVQTNAPTYEMYQALSQVGILKQIPSTALPQILQSQLLPLTSTGNFSFFTLTSKGSVIIAERGLQTAIGSLLPGATGLGIAGAAAPAATGLIAGGAGGTAAGATTGAAAGGPLAPITAIIGTIIGFIAGSLLPAIINAAKEYRDALLGGATVAAFSLFAGANALPSLIFGGLTSGLLSVTRFSLSSAFENLSAAISAVASGTVGATAAIFIASIIIVPAVVAIIAYMINSSALVTPRFRTTGGLDVPSFGTCPDDPNTFTPLPFPNDAPNDWASRAYNLVTDLLPGLWCYYNHQPYYDGDQIPPDPDGYPDSGNPDLWDESLYGQWYEYGSGTFNIFWCTYMVVEAWGPPLSFSLGYTPTMHNYFITNNQWVSIEDAIDQGLSNQVNPGDAVIVAIDGSVRGREGDHASIVWQVDPNNEFVTTIDSNAAVQGFTYTISGGEARVGDMTIVGFGQHP
jgi:hypothetical protein